MLYNGHILCVIQSGDYPLLNIKFNLDELYIDNPIKPKIISKK